MVIRAGAGVSGFRPGDRVACAITGTANHAEIMHVPHNLMVCVPGGCDLMASLVETAKLSVKASLAIA